MKREFNSPRSGPRLPQKIRGENHGERTEDEHDGEHTKVSFVCVALSQIHACPPVSPGAQPSQENVDGSLECR